MDVKAEVEAKSVEATFTLHSQSKAGVAAPQTSELRDRGHNYFVRHWRGELRLPLSFWTNGVLLTVIAFVINRLVAARPDLPVTIQIFVPALVMCFYVWSYVGIWRAAGSRTPAGADGWGWTARVVTLLWIGFMVLIVVFWAHFMANLERAGMNPFQPTASVATNIRSGVDEHGNHYLTLDGPIVPGDVELFAQAILEANNRGYWLDALRLNSPGGSIWEAMALAVMVRWVENMATVVQKDAKCESACFGILAAGYRKYVDPVSDPTQIGVHSVYALIKQQGGAPALFWKEREDTTIWAVRRLKALGVPDSIIGKIVTTSPDHMTYLTVEDLRQMGVEVTGYLGPLKAELPAPVVDTIYLSPAIVRADIRLDNGAVIPGGTVVVTVSDTWDANGVCLFPPTQDHPSNEPTRMCNISYHLPGGDISTAPVRESFLILIKQGWNSTPPPSLQQPLQPQPSAPPLASAQQPNHQENASKRDSYFRCTPAAIGKGPDPVTDIFVWLTVWQQGDTPQISYFDAWHHTGAGNTYKRSEQYEYIDRHDEISNMYETKRVWEGRLIRDRSIYMIGELAVAANGTYTYKEQIFHGEPGPKNRSEEVTNGVCKGVEQIPDWENQGPPTT